MADAEVDDIDAIAWYHTIDLPDGRTTRGRFDVRSVLKKVPLPDSLEGMRCLDVATCDGFYAFEMERRGAAEVHAIDLDDPGDQDWPGAGIPPKSAGDYGRSARTFALASKALGSRVVRHNMSVYDLSPETLGQFDFVTMGSVLLHLRDAIGALQAVRSVTRGKFLNVDVIDLPTTLTRPRTPVGRLYDEPHPRWWTPNAQAHRLWFRAADFTIEDSGWPIFVKYGDAFPPRPGIRTMSAADMRFWFGGIRRAGVPHQWVLARPAS